VALAVPVLAQTAGYYPGNTTTPLDGHCDVSLDGQVTFTKNVTINQTRDDYFKTDVYARFDPKARADAEAVKNGLNYNNYMEVGASTFMDNMSVSFSGFIGMASQPGGRPDEQPG
jgi:hypothetical protein